MSIDRIVQGIRATCAAAGARRAVLAGVTGIDGCGKGYLSERIVAALRDCGLAVAAINVDGWLRLPSQRFSPHDPARHFYEHGIRFTEMFEHLLLPLRQHRAFRLEADLADPTGAECYRRHVYEFQDVDVVLVEGIFLLRRSHRPHLDLTVWIDCTFETALERALARGQEGLPPDETVRDYRTIYFPAQRIHLAEDDPRSAATILVPNDSRLQGGPVR
jgi:uridine kinase